MKLDKTALDRLKEDLGDEDIKQLALDFECSESLVRKVLDGIRFNIKMIEKAHEYQVKNTCKKAELEYKIQHPEEFTNTNSYGKNDK
jgi:hypothetical protein